MVRRPNDLYSPHMPHEFLYHPLPATLSLCLPFCDFIKDEEMAFEFSRQNTRHHHVLAIVFAA